MSVIKDFNEIKSYCLQKWYYEPLTYGSVSNAKIIEFMDKGIITQTEINIIQYLYKFRAAPFDYIQRDCLSDFTYEQIKHVKENLIYLVKQKVLNMFNLVTGLPKDEEFDIDGLLFFTIDFGSIIILKSLTENETLDDWKCTDSIMTGVKTLKCMANIDLYYKVKKEKDFKYFNTYEYYASGKTRFENKATFKIGEQPFMCEGINHFDLFDGSDSKIFSKITKYEKFLGNENAWKFFFNSDKKPILLIVCSDKNTALDFGQRVNQLDIEKYVLCVLEENKKFDECLYIIDNKKLKRYVMEE